MFKYISAFAALCSAFVLSSCVYEEAVVTHHRYTSVPVVTHVVAPSCSQVCIEKRESNLASCTSTYNYCVRINSYGYCGERLESCRLDGERTYNYCYDDCGGWSTTGNVSHNHVNNTYINRDSVNHTYVNQNTVNNTYQNNTYQDNTYSRNVSMQQPQQHYQSQRPQEPRYQQQYRPVNQPQSVIITPPPSSDVDKQILNQNAQASDDAKLRLAEKLARRRQQEAEREEARNRQQEAEREEVRRRQQEEHIRENARREQEAEKARRQQEILQRQQMRAEREEAARQQRNSEPRQQSVIITPPPSSDLDKQIINQNAQASDDAKLRLAEKLARRRQREAESN